MDGRTLAVFDSDGGVNMAAEGKGMRRMFSGVVDDVEVAEL